MKINLIIKIICLFASTFAISGINIDYFIKKEHIWEARILVILFILGLSYISSEFLINFMNN